MKALLLHPRISSRGFWNYRAVCRLLGAEYPASPLGLITMAALLPAEWDLRLIDLNTAPLSDRDIDWADLVFMGAMLPQQSRLLDLVDRVHSRGKKVVVGGPDPTSQPEVYESADYLVLGEAERSLAPFLNDLAKGVPAGTYEPNGRPSMSETPVPRFDLLDLDNYLMVGVQFCRGCPFNCEFCDIIELYGRKPRTKSPRQIVAELEALHALGYRGHVDFVDDNFIGHKKQAKEILRAVKEWSAEHDHPFFFSTEASINLADDDELLALMQELDFRYVFVGIESADERVLASAQKQQNLNRDMVADLKKIQRHGIVVNGGFILGFDQESRACADGMIDVIERGNIVMAMVGLLFALPNTQLRRRLQREGRLLDVSTTVSQDVEKGENQIDQTTSGLNFITKRPKAEVLEDFLRVIDETYSTKNYFDRCLRLSKNLEINPRFKPNWRTKLGYARAFLKLTVRLGLRPSTCYYFWRNLFAVLLTNPAAAETVVNLMAMYLHFGSQAKFLIRRTEEKIRKLRSGGVQVSESAQPT
ncbi:MAG: B12-binding domain-containing radical SAM protein [Planctomycetes bacterium]|nr:B12-binding domain-containing radical SAM protein [Planctomycetota bacterium]